MINRNNHISNKKIVTISREHNRATIDNLISPAWLAWKKYYEKLKKGLVVKTLDTETTLQFYYFDSKESKCKYEMSFNKQINF